MARVLTAREWAETLLVFRQIRENPLPPEIIELINAGYANFYEDGWIEMNWKTPYFLLPWREYERNCLYIREEV